MCESFTSTVYRVIEDIHTCAHSPSTSNGNRRPPSSPGRQHRLRPPIRPWRTGRHESGCGSLSLRTSARVRVMVSCRRRRRRVDSASTMPLRWTNSAPARATNENEKRNEIIAKRATRPSACVYVCCAAICEIMYNDVMTTMPFCHQRSVSVCWSFSRMHTRTHARQNIHFPTGARMRTRAHLHTQ